MYSWAEGDLRAFLSYVKEDETQAIALAESLDDLFIDCFIARKGVEPTEDWEHQIRGALATCDCALALVSSRFSRSSWTNQEIGHVLGRGRPVVSLISSGSPPGFLAREQGVDINNRTPADIAPVVARLLGQNATCLDEYAAAVERRVAAVTNLQDAGAAITAAGCISNWSPTRSARIRELISRPGTFWATSVKTNALLAVLEDEQ